ncbi:Uncharacterized protein Fot_24525 [Forsythia ovata]|uniref:Uncharacterized protein n=1 Tax=Forsythia ovata TaxID=205694 RepID=A0ABD1U6H7_9LAMI
MANFLSLASIEDLDNLSKFTELEFSIASSCMGLPVATKIKKMGFGVLDESFNRVGYVAFEKIGFGVLGVGYVGKSLQGKFLQFVNENQNSSSAVSKASKNEKPREPNPKISKI